MVWPVMNPPPSLTRNRQVAAISSIFPCRPSGMPAASGGRLPYHSGLSRRVSMLPGETTFTRMLCGANSEASPRAKPTSAILAAERAGAILVHQQVDCEILDKEMANTSPLSRGRAHAREAAGNQRPWPADKVERWAI